MTPERVAEIATTHAYGCGIDSSGTQLITYRLNDIERAIRAAVNEALSDASKIVGECRVLVTEEHPIAVARETAKSLVVQISALKLPEE